VPFSQTGEKGLLCCLTQDPAKVKQLCDQYHINVEAFYKPAHRIIFTAIVQDWETPVDFQIFCANLGDHLAEVGDRAYLDEIWNFTNIANVEQYIRLVDQYQKWRQALRVSQRLLQGGLEEALGHQAIKDLQGIYGPNGDTPGYVGIDIDNFVDKNEEPIPEFPLGCVASHLSRPGRGNDAALPSTGVVALNLCVSN
jgi:hypothetical protein